MKTIKSLIILAVLVFTAPNVFAAVYDVDPNHTTVSFKIRHLFSKVEGRFGKFQGTFEYTPGRPDTWKTSGTIDVTSIDTNVPKRDEHLRSPEFFDVEHFPSIEFRSVKVTQLDAADGKVEGVGLITIHGVEKPIQIAVELHGEGKDPWGQTRLGFTATTKLNRTDFGLTWNKAVEAGKLLLGDEVEITIEVEGVKRAD